METGKTDRTYVVANSEFLFAVFGDDLADERPVVVTFEGNPASVPGKAWSGIPWHSESGLVPGLPANANNYFSLAVFRPDEAGRFRRRKMRFQALYAVMLDDVGTKVAADRMKP